MVIADKGCATVVKDRQAYSTKLINMYVCYLILSLTNMQPKTPPPHLRDIWTVFHIHKTLKSHIKDHVQLDPLFSRTLPSTCLYYMLSSKYMQFHHVSASCRFRHVCIECHFPQHTSRDCYNSWSTSSGDQPAKLSRKKFSAAPLNRATSVDQELDIWV